MKNLVVAPHVDDEILGCGGIIDENFFVYYCSIDESAFEKDETPVNERMKELKKSAEFLGYEWDVNTENRVNHLEMRKLIPIFEKIINKHKPEKIFIPYPSYNQDHKAVYEAALIALRPHDKNHFVKKVLLYEQADCLIWDDKEFKPNYFIPIDIERKIRAYETQKSQVREMRTPELIKNIAAIRGKMINEEYAEAFKILRWVD